MPEIGAFHVPLDRDPRELAAERPIRVYPRDTREQFRRVDRKPFASERRPQLCLEQIGREETPR